jgi:micrococcal nuclease
MITSAGRRGAPIPRRRPLIRPRAAIVALLALATIALGGTALPGCATATPTHPAASAVTSGRTTGVGAAGSATVVRVVDGDTIVVRLGGHDERVRFIGVDTPETVSPVKPVQCYGHQASDHTKQLLPPGTPVHLERDVEARDVYGRLLAYVWRSSDRLFVNLELARDGYASLLTIAPNEAHVTELSAAVASARDRGLGLWGRCGGPGVPASERS